MTVSMHALSAEVFAYTLANLSWILDKGLAHATQRKFDPGVLLAARLAPDMLPLTRQVQIACDLAKNSVARLAAQEPPRFEDNETSFEQLRARIARTLDYLKSVPASAPWSSRDWIFCSAGRFPTCSSTSRPPTPSCVITAWSSASATSFALDASSERGEFSLKPAATNMTNGDGRNPSPFANRTRRKSRRPRRRAATLLRKAR